MYKVIERKTILVENGNIKRGLKSSENSFEGFGELYFTEIHKNKVKGWKRHTKMQLNLLPVFGEILLYIKRELHETPEEVSFGSDDYKLVCIEPNTWFAFKGIADVNIMVNLASIEHDLSEVDNVPFCDN
jgi:dTDP-4-dehydrorhamnose 3,5-epimerase